MTFAPNRSGEHRNSAASPSSNDGMGYNPSLDGLRAFAVSAVVAFHAFPQYVPGGWIGVDVFFVLSGYLITSLLTREIDNNGRVDLPKFYGRRFLRLTPALWCVLAFAVLRAFASPVRDQQLLSAAISFVYLMNWNRVFDWAPPGILGHTWSLAIEEQFYLAWPLTLGFIRARRPRIWIAGLIAVIIGWRCFLDFSGASFERIYNGFDTHADPIMIGCLLALTPLSDRHVRLARATVLLPAFVFGASLLFFGEKLNVVKSVGMDVAPICTAWVIIAAKEEGWTRTILTQTAFRYTGKISYGWYLWHIPVLIVLDNFFIKHQFANPVLASWIAIISSYGIAVASHHLVEKPFLRLKDRLHPVQKVAAKDNPTFRLNRDIH